MSKVETKEDSDIDIRVDNIKKLYPVSEIYKAKQKASNGRYIYYLNTLTKLFISLPPIVHHLLLPTI
jgi:hypothetical protein